MAKLKMLKPRLKTINTSTIKTIISSNGTTERKRGSAGVKDRNAIRRRDCGLCQECIRNGIVTPVAGQHDSAVDHIVPLWRGGSDDDNNKELLCISCHDEKTKREAAERARGG